MSPATKPIRYPLPIRLLHWIVAVGLIGNLLLGWLMDDHDHQPETLHQSLGIALLGLTFVRIATRLSLRNALPPSTYPTKTRAWYAEKIVHGLLYLLMLVIPVLGWLKTNAMGHVANFFGLFALPTLLPLNREMGHLLGNLHALFAYGIAILIGLHVLATLARWVLKSQNNLPRISPFPTRRLDDDITSP